MRRRPDGVFIAYQVVGSGPVDLTADFHAYAGNVDLIWDEPDWGPFLLPFTEFGRLILHDRRGSGASTRSVPPPNLETRAADLLTVLDEIGSEAPVLSAAGSTGAMHALFAATYPKRTSGLFWNYPRARLAWAPDYPWGHGPEVYEASSRRPRAGARRSTPATSRWGGRPSVPGSRTTNGIRSTSTRS
jgi:hypothetical protein